MPSKERNGGCSCGKAERDVRAPTGPREQMCITLNPPGGSTIPRGAGGHGRHSLEWGLLLETWRTLLPQATASKHSQALSSKPVGGPSLFSHSVTNFAQDLGSNELSLYSQLCHWQAIRPWASGLTSWSLCWLFCNMGNKACLRGVPWRLSESVAQALSDST